MKAKGLFPSLFLLVLFCAFVNKAPFQSMDEPWKESQLMPPSELNQIIKEEKPLETYIFNIGPSGSIKQSIYIGETQEESSLKKLEKEVRGLSKDADIVIYCGCCPFKDCPNVRPAFSLLNDLGFTDHKLLDLPQNLKVDWIDKGYPME
ncbi:rhodanese-like domain-containing protein [Cytophagaceae bacterium ABcell3]|nr:rhodanese-like domain-containing protein [Cytophagaceae bacterium ABcell3]